VAQPSRRSTPGRRIWRGAHPEKWGKPIQQIRPGDVVWCPPGVKHWRGAAPTTAMTHLAVTATVEERNVTWMEKVSNDQYNAR
jgi:hypothetical protein